MRLKIGDKLYCKKFFSYDVGNNQTKVSFVEGKTYFISNIDDELYDDKNGNVLFVYVTEFPNKNAGLWFTYRGSTLSSISVWDYFYTEKELRKLKLERIKSYEK